MVIVTRLIGLRKALFADETALFLAIMLLLSSKKLFRLFIQIYFKAVE